MLISCRACFLVLLFTAAASGQTAPSATQLAKARRDEASFATGSNAWKTLVAEVTDQIKSGDPAKAADACSALVQAGTKMSQHADRPIRLLVDLHRPDLAEQTAAELAIACDANASAMAACQRARVQVFLTAHQFPEALSAARSYYDVARLKDSSDAITLLCQCLVLGDANDPTAAKRFKRQQIAWATGDPATQAAQADAPTSQPITTLGDPVLPTIPPDDKPYEAAAEAIDLSDYPAFVAKGNLLLLCGKAKEARGVFERAEALAPDNKAAEAIENTARAIRAAAGCVGPANAYILSARSEQQQQ